MNNLTKNAIKTSLEELLEKKPLSKITIQQIVDHCGIGRNTFYYHYQDIYMVIEDILDCRKKEISKQIQSNNSDDELSAYLVEFLIQNRNIIYHVYNSIDPRTLEKYIHDLFNDTIKVYIQNHVDLNKCNDEKIEFTIDFISYAYTGMIMNWLSKGMKEELLIHEVSRIKKHLNHELIKTLLYK